MDTTTAPTPQLPGDRPERDGDDVAETRSVPLIDQPTLPFGSSADEPIPFRLTARARRTVAPEQLPPLRVVSPAAPPRGAFAAAVEPEADGDLDDPRDTRGARARALRRAGMATARIAAQLEVDPLLVRAWVGDVVVPPAVLQAALRQDEGGERPQDGETDEDHLAFELARAAARDEVLGRLTTDEGFAAGLGVASALAEIDTHAVTVACGDMALVAMLVRWLHRHLAVEPARMRLVLRLDPQVAGDLERHRWAQATGLASDAVVSTRRRASTGAPVVEGLLRIADPIVAATLAGWRDALLEAEDPDRVDAAF